MLKFQVGRTANTSIRFHLKNYHDNEFAADIPNWTLINLNFLDRMVLIKNAFILRSYISTIFILFSL